jgi:Mrp family chromosome partitioning ATPase
VGRNAGNAAEYDLEAMKDTLVIGQAAKGSAAVFKPSVSPGTILTAERRPNGCLGGDLSLAKRVSRFSFLPVDGMEEFDSAARELTSGLAAKNYDRPSIAVTGTVRGEGRTETAVRLALALARQRDRRILLVDFDLRKPEVALRLGLSCKFFVLGDALRGDCRLGEALTFSEEDNLYVLPSRPPERKGDETLDGRQAEKLMADLHRIFDFVIIDCGPANQTDAVIVCRLAGGTALPGRCGLSRSDDMEASNRELLAAGAGVAGMILVGS